MRVRKAGRDGKRMPIGSDRFRHAVLRLQREPQVVRCSSVIRLEVERAAIGRDRLVIAIQGGKDQSQIVVELGFRRNQCSRALERRQRLRVARSLEQHDAEVMQCQRLFRLRPQGGAIRALGGFDIAALVGDNALLREGRSRRNGRCGTHGGE